MATYSHFHTYFIANTTSHNFSERCNITIWVSSYRPETLNLICRGSDRGGQMSYVS